MTIRIDQDVIERATATTGTLPDRIHCTPLDGDGNRVLPTRTAPTSGRVAWRWQTIHRPVTVRRARIRLGTQVGVFPLEKPVSLAPGDRLEITASLHNLRI